MRSPATLFAAVLSLLLLHGLPLYAGSVIVVDFGRHVSAETAARAEAEVNWTDADATDDTVCTQCFAALELQHYLRKMTGRAQDFPIADDDAAPVGDVILVGGPASNAASRQLAPALGIDARQLAKLGPEGYRIRSAAVDGRSVVMLAGGGRVGTLYAAYDLLYRLGCRWFAPGDLHEEVPRREQQKGTAPICRNGPNGASQKLDASPFPVSPMDVTQRPAFLTRGFLAWENRASPDFLLWMARNRMNYWCVEQKERGLMHKLGIRLVCGLHDAEELFLNPPSPYPYDHPNFQGDEGRPKDPYPESPQYQGDANRDGKLSYFEAHPEWFAMSRGKRIPGIQGWFGINFCTSNPHATTEFMKNYVRALIDGPYRDAEMLRFWTLDAGRWCECPECKALGIPTDRNLLLVWRLDREIKKARAEGKIHRPIMIYFLTYADVLHPPTRPLPPDFDYAACAATFYPIVRCYVHNLDDPACAVNRGYRQQLDGWVTDPKRHYRGQLAIGEYYNVSGYKCLPICFMHTMAHDIPFYHRTGAAHFDYMHVTTGNWGSKALTNYQMARQLWDVRTDCEALWKDYFAGRYGPAAATMRQFYESLEKMLSNVSELKYGLARRLNTGAKDLFPTSHLRLRRESGVVSDGVTLEEIAAHATDCRRLIDRAQAMASPERIAARLAEDQRVFAYAERTVAYYRECVEAFRLGRSGQRQEALQHYQEANRLAELLRGDTTSATLSSSHANAANAFVATNATGALTLLAKLLGQPAPAKK